MSKSATQLTPPQRRALRELWLAEQPRQPGSPAYPGAVGHVGVTLVKMGYAERLGIYAYGGGIRLVRYQLTPAGRVAAAANAPSTHSTGQPTARPALA